jgi:hypothetical protein
MLSANILRLLSEMAAVTNGAIVEVGSYIGGSIIAAARGVPADVQRRILAIECGGSHDHPVFPSNDILRDLRANIAAAGLAERIKVVPKRAEEVYPYIGELLQGQKIGLLVVDADGLVGIHLPAIAPHMAAGCVLVLDDYYDDQKGWRMRSFIAQAVRNRVVESFGVCGWGTWIGRVINPVKLRLCAAFIHDSSSAWQVWIPDLPEGDNDEYPKRSTATLLEDGVVLGPAHCLHNEIRNIGLGRWSHWGTRIYMSSSDNTDPTLNGRSYSLEVNGLVVPLNRPTTSIANRVARFMRRARRIFTAALP